jgi:hypothetical protein
MNILRACLWRGESPASVTGRILQQQKLPDYSDGIYNEYDVARLVRLVEKYSQGPYRFELFVDPFYEEVIREAQGHSYAGDDVVLNYLRLVNLVPFLGDDCGGWSRILEVFRPELCEEGDRVLAVGLDTVPVGDMSWLFEWDEAPLGLPLAQGYKAGHEACNNAVMVFGREAAGVVWERYQLEKVNGMKDMLLFGMPSEMRLVRRVRTENEWWPVLDAEHVELLSYKYNLLERKERFEDATLVYFHGHPKLHELDDADPVKRRWLHG